MTRCLFAVVLYRNQNPGVVALLAQIGGRHALDPLIFPDRSRMTASTSAPAPRNILVLGALTPVGRHVVRLLVESGAATDGRVVRAVDRALPQLAHLNAATQAAFAQVSYVQANMNNAGRLLLSGLA